jgi:hypothetical protein
VTWETEAVKSVQNRIVLVDLAFRAALDREWVTEDAGIWYWDFSTYASSVMHSFGYGNFGYGCFMQGCTVSSGTIEAIGDVTTVSKSGLDLVKRTSYALLVANQNSFYFDPVTTRLYIHMAGDLDPKLGDPLEIGISIGISNKAGYWNNVYYEPRLLGDPTIAKERDPFYYGIIRQSESTIRALNQDGFFDFVSAANAYGQPITVRDGFKDLPLAQFKIRFIGIINRMITGTGEIGFAMIDKRAEFSSAITRNAFAKSVYPYLKDGNVGRKIPVAWGPVFNVRCTCLNETEPAPASYTFKVFDVADHPGGLRELVAVRVENLAVTIASTSLLDAEFSLSTVVYVPGNIVTADVVALGERNTIEFGDCESATAPRLFKQTPKVPDNGTFVRDPAQAHSGTYSRKHAITTGGTLSRAYFNAEASVTGWATRQVTLSAWVYVPSVGGPALGEVVLQIGDTDGLYQYTDSSNPLAVDTWERLMVTRTLRAGITGLQFAVKIANTASSGEFIYVDDVQVELGAVATSWVDREAWDDPLALIEHIIEEYEGKPYGAAYYDTAEWEVARAHPLARPMGVWIDDDIKTVQIVSNIVNSMFAALIIKDDGLITARITDIDAVSIRTIERRERFAEPSVEQRGDEIVSTISVGYARDWNEREYRYYRNISFENEVFVRYRLRNERTFETYLTTEADAQALGDTIISIYKNARERIPSRTFAQNMDLELMDVVTINADRKVKQWRGDVVCEIERIEKRLLSGEVIVSGWRLR